MHIWDCVSLFGVDVAQLLVVVVANLVLAGWYGMLPWAWAVISLGRIKNPQE